MRKVFLVLIFLLSIVLPACSGSVSLSENIMGGGLEEQSIMWSKINHNPISMDAKRVSVSVLQDFFYDIEPESFIRVQPDNPITIAQLNERFPIVYCREVVINNAPVNYVVYPVTEGGCYFVVFSYATDQEGNSPQYIVADVFYINQDNLPRVEDKANLVLGETTYAEVLSLFPVTELVSYLSSGIYSYSLLSSDQILKIEYDGDIYAKDQKFVVQKYEIIPRESAFCIFSVFRSDDLIFQ